MSRPDRAGACTPRVRRLWLAVPLAALVTLAACGSDAAAKPTNGDVPSAPVAESAAANGEGGNNGEAAGVRFTSSRYHYRVDAPGGMTEAPDGTASAQRGIERLTITVVSGGAVSDSSAFAQTDLPAVAAQSPKFKPVSRLTTVTLSRRSVAKVVYSWTNGNNPVTGRSEDLVSARYYIPRDSSTLAVVTYAVSSSQYDPQGADDVVSTFQWQ